MRKTAKVYLKKNSCKLTILIPNGIYDFIGLLWVYYVIS